MFALGVLIFLRGFCARNYSQNYVALGIKPDLLHAKHILSMMSFLSRTPPQMFCFEQGFEAGKRLEGKDGKGQVLI